MRRSESGPRSVVTKSGNTQVFLLCVLFLSCLQPVIIRGSEPASPRAGARHAISTPTPAAANTGRPRFIRAFVVDDRLSALRRDPDEGAPVLHRLHLARQVFLVESKSRAESPYCRVAVSRKTRGWLHKAALVVPGRAGDDSALLKLIKSTVDPADRIVLCRLMDEHFKNSPLDKQSLLLLGEEADRVAKTLSKRANKRLAGLNSAALRARMRDYYVNDSSLDRYSRLSVRLKYNEESGEYVYDGSAYSAIIKRFPESAEAVIARQRLDKNREKLARR